MQPIIAMLIFYTAIAALLACGHSLPTFGHTCPSTQVPPTNARGVNRLNRNSNTPLYRLEIVTDTGQNLSTGEATTYRVKISAENDHFPFSEAKISLASTSPCETGSLTFHTHDFFDARQSGPTCPRLLMTNRKLPMGDLPSLTWKPPACGCIQFRAVVVSVSNVYYADNEDVENGPLSQTVCVHQKATRELYLTALCHVAERYSSAEIISRPSFLQRHQVDVKWMDKHGLEMGLELRRSDNRLCCSKSSMEAKMTCFGDSRRRRVDRFCEDGYPDIPFTSFRVTHMRDREKHCCFLLGEHRYRCFAEKSDLARGPAVTRLDFTQDETDPVNDLAEFASTDDTDIMRSIGTVTFGDNNRKDGTHDKDDSADGDKKDDVDDDDDDDDDTANKQTAMKSSTKTPLMTEASQNFAEIVRDFSSPLDIGASNGHHHSPAESTRSNTKTIPNHGRTKLGSSERKTLNGNNGGTKNSLGSQHVGRTRISSREYTADGRPAPGANGRRGSGERADRTQTNEGRNKHVIRSNSGGTGQSRETPQLSSAEKRAKRKDSAQRRQDWVETGEPDFEDQGGKSVAVTLDKLQKQMDRLRMRRHCCEAGAAGGRPVYGWFSPVRKECEHSGQKYIQTVNLRSGLRSCLDQFIKCCIELAVSGPVVTSSEFRDNQYLFANNRKKLGSAGGLSALERREEDSSRTPGRPHPDEMTRDIPSRETPEAYEFESEKRFKTMRETDVAPKDDDDDDDDDEKDGPKRFDEADVDANKDFDIFDRKDETVNKVSPKDKDGDEIEDVVEKNLNATDKTDKSDESTELSTTNNEQKKKEVGDSSKEPIKGHLTDPLSKDNLDRMSDLVDNTEKQDGDFSRQQEESLLAKTSGGRSRQIRNRAGAQSNGGRSSSRENRHSKGASQERQRYSQNYYSNRVSYKLAPSGKIGTEDSQEMAAAHGRKFVGALDSREMVDAHRKTHVKSTDLINDSPSQRPYRRQKYNRRKWY